MADPLGLLGGGTGGMQGKGLQDVLRTRGNAGDGAGATDANGDTFKDALLKSIDQVNQLQGEAAAAQEDLASGKTTNVEDVMLATQKADTAFRALLAVRNKVQLAFDELKQVRI